MNKGTVKVSAEFTKFVQRAGKAVEEAKKAENNMQTCAMPVGYKGQAVVVGGTCDRSKDKKDDKGVTIEGKPYVRLDFSVIGDEKYNGKKFNVIWFLNATQKQSVEDRFMWMFNNMETMGLPRDLRESGSIEDALNYFISGDHVFDYEVEPSTFTSDRKQMRVTRRETVDDSDSVVPEMDEEVSFEVGQEVNHLGKTWKIEEIDEEGIHCKSLTSGNIRVFSESDLKG